MLGIMAPETHHIYRHISLKEEEYFILPLTSTTNTHGKISN
jgi:hypothetical protein